MERKRIHIPSLEERALKALSTNENGADYHILEILMGSVLQGREIDPDFQKVANAIVAQSILCDGLPPKKRGRPKDGSENIGISVAAQYYEMIDAGVGYANAVEKIAADFHKDERHIMRIVKANKHWIGETKERRDSNRKWWRICAEMEEKVVAQGGKPASVKMLEDLEAMREEDSKRDPISELDDQINDILSRLFPATDTK